MGNEGYGEQVDATITIEERRDRALVPVKDIYRHPLYTKKKKKYLKEIEKELALDAKLGLNTMSEGTAKKALAKDIDDLTNSRQFCEITKKGLYRLFGINWMNLYYCIPYNFMQKVKAVHQILLGTFKCKLYSACFLFLIPLAFLGYTKATWSMATRWHTLGNTFILVVFCLLGISLIAWLKNVLEFTYEKPEPMVDDSNEEVTRTVIESHSDKEEREKKEKEKGRIISYSKINVSLKVVPLDQSEIEIPPGAKLKTAEALDTKIFQSFVIAYPKFNVEKHKIHIKERIIPRINLDPAICGVTLDNRLFMIVYWDVKKDIEKIISSITHFKKFKLER